ncbi:hypothetical protein L218DRAFT_949685 [Marasmius fiardii PR-910]|nr:hypothetical protein L218DRAFT_949685 [Marasmius fiardii PR-910]
MPSLRRALTFYYEPHQLTKDTNLIFTFIPGDSLSEEQNRAAWKVVPVIRGDPAGGTFTVDYQAEFGFSPTQFENGTWSIPTQIGGDNLQARDGTDTYKSKVVCTNVKKGDYLDLDPAFGSHATVTTNFHPKLLMYSTMDYQNLNALEDEFSDWNFVELPNSFCLSPLDDIYFVAPASLKPAAGPAPLWLSRAGVVLTRVPRDHLVKCRFSFGECNNKKNRQKVQIKIKIELQMIKTGGKIQDSSGFIYLLASYGKVFTYVDVWEAERE